MPGRLLRRQGTLDEIRKQGSLKRGLEKVSKLDKDIAGKVREKIIETLLRDDWAVAQRLMDSFFFLEGMPLEKIPSLVEPRNLREGDLILAVDRVQMSSYEFGWIVSVKYVDEWQDYGIDIKRVRNKKSADFSLSAENYDIYRIAGKAEQEKLLSRIKGKKSPKTGLGKPGMKDQFYGLPSPPFSRTVSGRSPFSADLFKLAGRGDPALDKVSVEWDETAREWEIYFLGGTQIRYRHGDGENWLTVKTDEHGKEFEYLIEIEGDPLRYLPWRHVTWRSVPDELPLFF